MEGKVIIFSAPSGSGKTTIIKQLLAKDKRLSYSISATTRDKRNAEKEGVDYYFLSEALFREKIKAGELIEWEEVYDGIFYGTLRSEIQRIWNNGQHVIFDVDVKGGLNLKKIYGERALGLFIQIPSLEILEKRLKERGTDSDEDIKRRLAKARYEMSFCKDFDYIIYNHDLTKSVEEAENCIRKFINNS